MCDAEVIEWFVDDVLDSPEDFKNKRVLEVGSKYVNGGVRHIIERMGSPKEYVGVDIQEGEGVDFVVSAEGILDKFGENSFDVVVTTEMMEHVKDWRLVINNIKKVLRPEGLLFLTTRSYGFQYHAYPHDFWRYNEEDMKRIFADFQILAIKNQREWAPGIFLKARKPKNHESVDLSEIALYSIAVGKRTMNYLPISFKRKVMLVLRKRGLIKRVI